MRIRYAWLRHFFFLAVLVIPLSVYAVDFQIGWELEAGASSFCVALGDIDQDSDLDAYVCDFDGSDTVWLNNGSGVFTRSSQVLDSGRGSKAAFALLDGDAFPDLFLVRHLSDNRVYINDTNGVLVDSGQSLGPNSSKRGLALGLLDGNATIDAFVPYESNNGNRVFLNDGTGTFTDTMQELGSSSSACATLADVGEDANGDLDAIVCNNGFNKVYWNDGAGNFTDSGNVGTIATTYGVAAGLLDNDANIDIFFANSISGSPHPNEVLFGDGDGTFTVSGETYGNAYSFPVVLHDFDNQNGPDAFVGNNSGTMDKLWLNDGDGTFTDSGQTLGVGAAIDVATGLINNDAHMDVFVANRYQPDKVWLGDGAGNFTDSGQLLGSSAANKVALGDLDGDTDLDAVVGHVAGITRVFFNDGDGNFTDTNQWLSHGLGNNNGDVAIADFDGMNGADIFIANSKQGNSGDEINRIWLNDGSGNFTNSGQSLGAEASQSVAVGDVDGGGDTEALVANFPLALNPGTNVLYTNAAGVMTDSGQDFGDGDSTVADLVDVDGDTDLDAFIGNRAQGNWIFLNGESGNPLGTFSDSGQSLGSNETQAVDFGLINDDVHIDMFEGNDGANKVWYGDGAGNFADSGQSLGNLNTQSVHLFDADDDGDMDVWITNGSSSAQVDKVWINDGDGNFTDEFLIFGTGESRDSAMALLNNDNLPDVFVVNAFGAHTVWLNETVTGAAQVITPDPTAQNASIGNPVSIDVDYSTSDDNESLSGIGLRLHWDSSQLSFVNLTSVWAGDLVSSDNTCQADGSDFDSDPSTDCYVETVWDDPGDDWPGTGNTPTPLYTANFNSNVDFEQTTNVNFSASTLAMDYELDATSASVTNPDMAEPEYESDPIGGTTLLFGNVEIMTTSAPQVVDVDNVGDANLTLSCALLGPHAAEYEITSCPTPVVPAGSTQLSVVCEPVTPGVKNALLRVTTNDSDEPQVDYPLNCTGTADPEFDPDPIPGTTLDFGSVMIATTSSPETVDVDNLGSGMLLMACTLSGPNADQFSINNCPSPVAPAGMAVLAVTCAPTTIGVKTASLDVMTNDSDEMNVSWPLTCNAIESDVIDMDGFEDP